MPSPPASSSREPAGPFWHIEALSGIALLLCAAAALVWANSPWDFAYERLWQVQLPVGTGRYTFSRSLHFWMSDGLMALFFLMVGPGDPARAS